MRHCDPDALALASLGEPALGGDDALHLAGCNACRQELAGLRDAVTAARGPIAEPVPVTPPHSVWQAVAAATGVPVAAHPAPPATPGPLEPSSPPASAPASTLPAPPVDPHPGTPPAALPAGPSAPGRRWAPRVRRTGWYAAAAAVVAAAAGVAVGAGLDNNRSGDSVDPGDAGTAGIVVAVAELGPLPTGPAAGGTARVREAEAAGALTRSVEVDVTGLASADGYYEVWLLDGDGGLVSLGVLPDGANSATLPVPASVDLLRFSLLDVSAERLDGDPGHSAVSVARGELVLRS